MLLCITYLAILAASRRAWAQPTFWLPLVWYVLTCQRIRHAPLFAIIAGIAVADLLPRSPLAGWLTRRRWLRQPSAAGTDLRPGGRGRVLKQLALILVILTAPLMATAVWLKQVGPLPLIGAAWSQPPGRVFPKDLIAPLRAYAKERADGTPVYNEPILGGFLIDNFPTLRVFIDGRCELYGEPFLRGFVAAWNDPSRIGQWQKEFGFRAAIIEAGSPLRSYFDNNAQWRLVAEAPAARFYRMEEARSGDGEGVH
jgi:hypothetical protein